MLKKLRKQIINNPMRILYHIAFWAFYVLFYSFMFGYPDRLMYIFKGNLVSLPLDMLPVYFTIYFLLPRYLEKRRYFSFVAGLLISALVIVFVQRAFSIYVFYAEANQNTEFFTIQMFNWFIYIYVFVFLALIIKLTKSWYTNYRRTKELEKEKLETEIRLKEAEINLLKNQNHPHFLFNTLNNLYGLTLEKSDHAPEVVLKLSGLLDYMLYDCNENEVPLKKEIDHLQNYIALEKLRYDNSLQIDFGIDGNIDEHKIAPLLLLPFVENSFKHGVSRELENPFILINLFCRREEIIFSIKNSKASLAGKMEQTNTGIGLQNVKKRIELAYKNNFQLEIEDEQDVFSVFLKLNVNPGNNENQMYHS